MLFNSYEFIFGFLPVVWVLVLGIARRSHPLGKLALFVSSVVFYAFWSVEYLGVLFALMVVTFGIARLLMREPSAASARWRLPLLLLGIGANLGVLGYFKYSAFVLRVLDDATGAGLTIPEIVLPLGLSFFVFQKIAFLVDVYNGAVKKLSLLDFCLFVTFFPQLVAGPIVHHREIVPQFAGDQTLRWSAADVSAGLSMFVLGLFKKVAIADVIAPIATALYDAAARGEPIPCGSAWLGTLVYTLQLYFDFSGYSDMAVGLALLFAVRLPQNFNSPLKARNIIDFWARWHMSLSRFLTAYLYNPLSLSITRYRMSRGWKPQRGRVSIATFVSQIAFPTLVTMFLAGIWHGAGWQFLVFGIVHGVYLVANHAMRAYAPPSATPSVPRVVFARVSTLLAVMASLVFFRAPSLTAAGRVFGALFAGRGGMWAVGTMPIVVALAALAVSQFAPNTNELILPPEAKTGEGRAHAWRWSPAYGFALGIAALIAITRLARPSEFLYFQF